MQEIQESDNQILTPLQVEKFQKIFAQYTIKESDNKQKTNKKVTVQQKKEAFFVTLHMLVCWIVHAMPRSKDTTSHSKEKQYLTTKYTFDNDEICKIAF
ncbi:2721_t:CDS:2 [Gigaspora rosea]|nr:2721_t:CDS:2 [Gigaspora rosea]